MRQTFPPKAYTSQSLEAAFTSIEIEGYFIQSKRREIYDRQIDKVNRYSFGDSRRDHHDSAR